MRRLSIVVALFVTLVVGITSVFAAAPVYMSEPYLLKATTSSMTVVWITDVAPSEAKVEYGSSSSYGSTQAATIAPLDSLSTGILYQAIATITGLSANTTYHYRAVSKSGADATEGSDYTFKTAVPPGTPFNFLECSDEQLKDEVPATLREMAKYEADLILFPGDLINTVDVGSEWVGGDAKTDTLGFWRAFQAPGVELVQNMPIYPSPGNHDFDYKDNVKDTPLYGIAGDDMATYCQMFRPLYPDQEYQPGGKHWYSFDYGDVHFVSLSVLRWWVSNIAEAPGRYIFDPMVKGSPQYQWLENDLATTDKPYIIVIHHHPIFGTGSNIVPPFGDPVDYAEDYIHRDLVPLYEKYGVSIVFSGHDHTLEHYFVRGVHYGQFSSIGNTYGIHVVDEPHGQTAVYEMADVRGFLWAQVTSQQITCKVIQGGYLTPGAGTVLHEFVIEPRTATAVEEEAFAGPLGFALSQAYPNPFNPVATIQYALPQASQVRLSIYDALGQPIRTLVDERCEAGAHSAVWDGTNDAGRAVGSGIYLYKMEAGEFVMAKKMMLLR